MLQFHQSYQTMHSRTDKPQLSLKYILLTAGAVAFTWLLHELAHWATGTMLGYDMAMTINKAYTTNLSSHPDWQWQLVNAAGPFITLVQAFLVYFAMRRKNKAFLYPFLFACFYCRLLAGGLSFIRPNDEARLSDSLGMGKAAIPILVVGLLFLLVRRISSLYKFGFWFNLITLLLTIFFTSAIILSDQYFQLRLI